MPPYKVYVRTDQDGRIIEINSDAFLPDTTGLTYIDEGYGDKYHHAQGNYLPKPLYDDRGILRYKLVDGSPVERTKDEMDADFSLLPPPPPTTEEKLTQQAEVIDEHDAALCEVATLTADNQTITTEAEDAVVELAALVAQLNERIATLEASKEVS